MAYTVSMREVKKLLNYAIDNNLKLEEKGVTPIAVSLEAGAGIGKTSVVQQVAEERNMQFKKISLHELDEVGDLIGSRSRNTNVKSSSVIRTTRVNGR